MNITFICYNNKVMTRDELLKELKPVYQRIVDNLTNKTVDLYFNVLSKLPEGYDINQVKPLLDDIILVDEAAMNKTFDSMFSKMNSQEFKDKLKETIK